MPHYKEFVNAINSYANYYNLLNHKRWASLVEWETLNEIKQHLKLFKLFAIRWAPSKLLAIQRLMVKFVSLCQHLLQMSGDSSFTEASHDEAKCLRSILLNENFLSLTFLQIDVLSTVTTMSLAYQKRGQTYINEFSRQTSFREEVQQLKQYKGKHLSSFLDEVKCSNDVNQMKRYIESGGTTRMVNCGSLFNYENSRFKIYKLQLLNSGNPNFVPLSTYFHKNIMKPCPSSVKIYFHTS